MATSFVSSGSSITPSPSPKVMRLNERSSDCKEKQATLSPREILERILAIEKVKMFTTKYPSDEFKNDTYFQSKGITVSTILGQGAFGKVLLAQSEKYGKSALKCTLAKTGNKAMEREALFLSRLVESDYLPKFHLLIAKESTELNNTMYMMEYCPCNLHELDEEIHNRGESFSSDQIKLITHDVLSALKALSDQGFAHLDVKVDNCLVSVLSGVDGFRIKLGDLGSAKEISKPLPSLSYQTIWFRSPHILTLKTDGNDPFSVACLIAFLVNHSHPFAIVVPEYPKMPSHPTKADKEEYQTKLIERNSQEMRTYLAKVFGILGQPSAEFVGTIPEEIKKRVPITPAKKEFKLPSILRPKPPLKPVEPSPIQEMRKSRHEIGDSKDEIDALADLMKKLFNYEKPLSYADLLEAPFFKAGSSLEDTLASSSR